MSRPNPANPVSKMHNDLAQTELAVPTLAERAALFLETEYPRPHRDKRIARDYRISPSMARVLRAGRGWTAERLDQAVRLYGHRFVDALFGAEPDAHELRAELDGLKARLARLEERGR